MRLPLLAAIAILFATPAQAFQVGERHLQTTEASAALRDAQHRDALRITVWYPANAAAVEQGVTIGPPDRALFYVGEAAPDAGYADDRRRPVILLSHGFGGSARMMGWFGIIMAQQGYVVIAVDHPGNNSLDPMTLAGATLFWERPGDLAAALQKVRADPELGRRLDMSRVGVAGFSAGGFTALAAAGARVDLARFVAFCADHPQDGDCAPQPEFAASLEDRKAFLASPEAAPSVTLARGDLSLPDVRAVFLMAPGMVQAFDPRSLSGLTVPVSIILGDSDDVASPNTNGGVVARAIPGARLKVLARVGHYDFLSQCTPAGYQAQVPICPTAVPRAETHHAALEAALQFFNRTLGGPP